MLEKLTCSAWTKGNDGVTKPFQLKSQTQNVRFSNISAFKLGIAV